MLADAPQTSSTARSAGAKRLKIAPQTSSTARSARREAPKNFQLSLLIDHFSSSGAGEVLRAAGNVFYSFFFLLLYDTKPSNTSLSSSSVTLTVAFTFGHSVSCQFCSSPGKIRILSFSSIGSYIFHISLLVSVNFVSCGGCRNKKNLLCGLCPCKFYNAIPMYDKKTS